MVCQGLFRLVSVSFVLTACGGGDHYPQVFVSTGSGGAIENTRGGDGGDGQADRQDNGRSGIAGSHTDGGGPSLAVAGSASSGAGGPLTGTACAAKISETRLQPVNLLFAFDVSGSMGKLDKPYHDPKLKWEPVVNATKAFFADPSSNGIFASLAFFPAKKNKCDVETYEKPDVPMTELPSSAFGDAIDAVTPKSSDDWRGGTPTLAVVQGAMKFAKTLASSQPEVKRAMVLVTDGYPQDCDDNTIEAVSDAVHGVADELPTYVIGVANPAGGPDTVSDLQQIARAGGTQAFIIETGNSEKTAADFRAVIDGIRGRTVSCRLPIPPAPEGEVFEATKVNVTSWIASSPVALGYDSDCAAANAWRYDDASRPTGIEICPDACAALQADAAPKLLVEFGCQQRIPEIH